MNRFWRTDRNRYPDREQSGYLLFEVLLALAILTIVVVLVFRIIQTTVRTTADVTFLQGQQEKIDGIFELLRQNFSSMPLVTQFSTRHHNEALELIFARAPFNFSFAPAAAQFGTVVLAARPQSDGRSTLSVLQEPEDAATSYVDTGKETSAHWVPLVNNLDGVTWRFFDRSNKQWQDEWTESGTKPVLVELSFRLAGKSQVQRGVFLWPAG